MRPLVADSVVIGLINNGEVKPSHFLVRAGGVALTSEGRGTVLKAYERRLRVELTHPLFGYKVSYRRLLELQVRVLAAHLLGEIDRYVPVMTR
jgi:CRISPR-associated protein Cas1